MIRPQPKVVFAVLVALGVGFVLGAISYRQFFISRHFRKPPREIYRQPLVSTPKATPPSMPPPSPLVSLPANTEVAATDAFLIPLLLTPRNDDALVWEAEWANRITGTWEILPGQNAGGNLAVWSREGTGRNADVPPNPTIALGVAVYYFHIPISGAYHLYLRIRASDHCGDSCYAGIDTMNVAPFPGTPDSKIWPDAMYHRWIWLKWENPPLTLSAGPHTLRLEVREDGFAIDQIALLPEGVQEPAGLLAPNILPGLGPLPNAARFSEATPSTGMTAVTTPFDGALAVVHHVIGPAENPGVNGWVWLRAHAQETQTIQVALLVNQAQMTPSTNLTVTLTPQTPFALIPITAAFPVSAPRGGYDLRATFTCAQYPQLTIERRVPLINPFDWRAIGPVNPAEDRLLQATLCSATQIDFALPPAPTMPKRAWKPALSPNHYDEFGTIDLSLLCGYSEDTAAYLATRIVVKRTDAYQVYGTGDDSLDLYCDGRLLVQNHNSGPLTDTLAIYPMTLQQGEHLLVARVGQQRRSWQMHVEFRTPAGLPSEEVMGLPGGQ